MKRVVEMAIKALKIDPSIGCQRDQVHNYIGFSEEHFLELGLTRKHLKRLERLNLAVRGYQPNKPVFAAVRSDIGTLEKKMVRHHGFEVRWLLLRGE